MALSIDSRQNTKISLVVAFITILTGGVGLLAYLETKKHNRINNEVLRLDREIKTLELAQKRWQAKKDGVVL